MVYIPDCQPMVITRLTMKTRGKSGYLIIKYVRFFVRTDLLTGYQQVINRFLMTRYDLKTGLQSG